MGTVVAQEISIQGRGGEQMTHIGDSFRPGI